mgnify:CR=1 FL=1|jgi:hypothetical protein
MEMEKPFPCFVKEIICFLNLAGCLKDIFGGFEKTIFFGFLGPFSETLYVAFVMFDPVFNQMGKVIVTKFFGNCYSLLLMSMEFMV